MSTPAGWYPDPERVGFLRWWDGQLWTEHRQPMPTSAPEYSGSQGLESAVGASSAGQGQESPQGHNSGAGADPFAIFQPHTESAPYGQQDVPSQGYATAESYIPASHYGDSGGLPISAEGASTHKKTSKALIAACISVWLVAVIAIVVGVGNMISAQNYRAQIEERRESVEQSQKKVSEAETALKNEQRELDKAQSELKGLQ